MRGNPLASEWSEANIGSIPAHAGQPHVVCECDAHAPVYPRACGATPCALCLTSVPYGLSPRMRGNLVYRGDDGLVIGSIPAHAGQPAIEGYFVAVQQVYPRACGATLVIVRACYYLRGLSPRMRGNLVPRAFKTWERRSIPAHAGQPSPRGSIFSSGTVYPRACGATADMLRSHLLFRGLSPRMRGNRPCRDGRRTVRRSIPAHAGQPQSRAINIRVKPVYPRACGATDKWCSHLVLPSGLSPRMRGNPLLVTVGKGSSRSIPAHAGQPISRVTVVPVSSVYPRACGATSVTDASASPHTGLSPRMRGNLTGRRKCQVTSRSIPAHAGQP